MKNNIVLKILGIVAVAVVLFFGITSVITKVGVNKNLENIKSFEKVEIENQLVPYKDENGYWTFTTDRDFKVVQLTDVHIGIG